jgi:hypothetical protein
MRNPAILPQGTETYSPSIPGDVTTVFPDMYARAVVSLVSPLVEYTVPVLVLVIVLVQYSVGSYVPPSSSLPLFYNNPCWLLVPSYLPSASYIYIYIYICIYTLYHITLRVTCVHR